MPPYRWGGSEDLVHDTSGWLGAIEGAPTALGNVLFTLSSLMWQGLMWIVKIGVTFGDAIWDALSLPVAQLTALFGGQLFPMSVAVLFFTIFSGIRNVFTKDSSKSMLMAMIRLARGWIVPFLLLATLVMNSNTAVSSVANWPDNTEEDRKKKNDEVKAQVWTIPWIAHTTESVTSSFASSLANMETDNFMQQFTDKDGVTTAYYNCTDYINAIYADYLGSQGLDKKARHNVMVSVSKLWVKTHYDNVIRGQFGTTQRGVDPQGNQRMYDLPGIVGCRAYESWNRVPVTVQHALTEKSYKTYSKSTSGSGIKPKAEAYGPHADKHEFIASMTAWAACVPNGDGKAMTSRPPYVYVQFVSGSNSWACKSFFLDEGYNYPGGTGERSFKGDRKESNIYIFGKDSRMLDVLTHESPCGDDLGKCDEKVLKEIRPAQELGRSMSGGGWTRVIYGMMSLIVSVIAMWVLGPMSVGLVATLFMSIGLLVLGLPAALLLSAAGKPDKARPLYRMIMSSLLAKSLFLFLITATLLLVTLLNSLIIILESHLANGLNSMVGALLYGAVPLLAFFVVNVMLKKVMPGANLSSPLSTMAMATKGAAAGWGADNFQNKWNRKGKFNKDGSPAQKQPKPGSLAAKLQQSRLGQKAGIMKAQADQAVPSWRKIKKMSRFGKANELYKEDQEALAKKKIEYQQNLNKRKAKKEELKQYREDSKELKEDNAEKLEALKKEGKNTKKAPQDEGLSNKRGKQSDPAALKKGAALTKTPTKASSSDRTKNAKDNKAAKDKEVIDYANAHGVSPDQAQKELEKAKMGKVLSQNERDTIKGTEGAHLGYVDKDGNPDGAAIAKNIVTTSDGKAVHIGNVLANPNAKGMSEDDLWNLMTQGGAAFGLGKDVLDTKLIQIDPSKGDGKDNFRLETETEYAARIQATLEARGLVDADGAHVHPMQVLGVKKNQVHKFVETGSTGDKSLDDALKDYMNGESKLFESSDAKYEKQQIMVAQEIETERTQQVTNSGLTVANRDIAQAKVAIKLKDPVFQQAQEVAALKLVLALPETDPADLDGLLHDTIAECVKNTTATLAVDDEMKDALQAQFRNNLHNSIMKAAKDAAGQFNPTMIKAIEGLSQTVVVSGALSDSASLPPLTDTDVGATLSGIVLKQFEAQAVTQDALAVADPGAKKKLVKHQEDLAVQIKAETTRLDVQMGEYVGRLRQELENVGRTRYAAADHECAKLLDEFDQGVRDIWGTVHDLRNEIQAANDALPADPGPYFAPTDPTAPTALAAKAAHDRLVAERNAKKDEIASLNKDLHDACRDLLNRPDPAAVWSTAGAGRRAAAPSGLRSGGFPAPTP